MNTTSKVRLFLFVVLNSILLSSCTVGPDYKRPETVATVLKSYQNGSSDSFQKLQEEKSVSHWWRSMQDPLMDKYISILLEDNPSLEELRYRVAGLWEQKRIVFSSFFPSISASIDVNRSFRPIDSIFVEGLPGAGLTNERFYDTSLQLLFYSSWQIDWFGKLGKKVKAAEVSVAVTRAEYFASVHTLIAELAFRRVSSAALARLIDLIEEIAKNREETLEVVERRFGLGTGEVSVVDVYLARENFLSVKAEIPVLKQRLFEEMYSLDILLGKPPGFSAPLTEDAFFVPPLLQTPVGVPIQLLDRRPDLISAEMRIIAQTYSVGVALADLYPDLSLTGNIGFENDKVDNLFSSKRLIGNIASSIVSRLFEGGSLRARVRLEELRVKELIAQYEKLVLQAIMEVEIAMAQERYLSKRIELLSEAVKAAQNALKHSRERYEQGIDTLLNLLEAERSNLALKRSLIETIHAKWNTRISLYLALGGDWLKETDRKEVLKK